MPKMIEVEIDSVRVSLTNQQRIVILKEKNVAHYLPIWIGLYEAEAITIALQEIQVARPQTHDLLKTLIHALNAQLLRVEVVSLQDDVFYGNLILKMDGQQYEVDCRPSDALALAARARAPIFISEGVMEKAGIIPEDDISEGTAENLKENKISNGEDANLDIFEDFLQNIDPNQLGKDSEDEDE